MNTKPESNSSEPASPSLSQPALLTELLWTAIGLLLTIFSTFFEAFVTNPPWEWFDRGIYSHSLGITYQVGAVLLTGCMGGRNAGAGAQVGYLLLGLAWLPVFAYGGGWDYWQKPTFGYLLGFVPGAWLCGYLAFRRRPKIEHLTVSALAGLGMIHLWGMAYLLLMALAKWGQPPFLPLAALPQALLNFSVLALPSQIILVCMTAVLAYFLRKLLFY